MNKLQEKDILWKLLHTWHIVLTLFMGLLSWLAFLYMYIKGKKKTWLISAIIYGTFVVGLIYLVTKFPDQKNKARVCRTIYLWIFCCLDYFYFTYIN